MKTNLEKNTVILSLEEYNHLRDKKREFKIIEDDLILIKIYKPYGDIKKIYCTKDEGFKEISELTKELNDRNNELRGNNEKLFNETFDLKQQFEKINKMSFLQFRKWKKEYRKNKYIK